MFLSFLLDRLLLVSIWLHFFDLCVLGGFCYCPPGWSNWQISYINTWVFFLAEASRGRHWAAHRRPKGLEGAAGIPSVLRARFPRMGKKAGWESSSFLEKPRLWSRLTSIRTSEASSGLYPLVLIFVCSHLASLPKPRWKVSEAPCRLPVLAWCLSDGKSGWYLSPDPPISPTS